MSMENTGNVAGARKPAKREDERTVAGERRMMRRADRDVTDREQIAAILSGCDIVDVAYTDAEGLTVVPLNFGYDYDVASGAMALWFHGPTARWWPAVPRATGARRSSRSSATARPRWSRIWTSAATDCRR